MKPFYESKTLWFNVLALIVIVATSFGFADFEASGDIVELGSVIVAVVNYPRLKPGGLRLNPRGPSRVDKR